MNAVIFEGDSIALDEGESVLDALLREGHSIPNGCRSGVCQSCLLSAEEAVDITAAQSGLSDTQRQLNYFLSCQCRPLTRIRARRVDSAAHSVEAEIVAKRPLGEKTWLLRLRADIQYSPGQYVTLWKDASLARSYSLASLPNAENTVELHVREYPGGQFSGWIADAALPGDKLYLQGPLGKCVYTACTERSLFLAATGTGLAPVWGIARDALSQGHTAPIHMVVGARERTDFYLLEQLYELAATHDNIVLHLVCLGDIANSQLPYLTQGDVYQYCRSWFADMKGFRVYLCGAHSFVTKMRKQCFLAGASMGDIHADAFLPFGGSSYDE